MPAHLDPVLFEALQLRFDKSSYLCCLADSTLRVRDHANCNSNSLSVQPFHTEAHSKLGSQSSMRNSGLSPLIGSTGGASAHVSRGIFPSRTTMFYIQSCGFSYLSSEAIPPFWKDGYQLLPQFLFLLHEAFHPLAKDGYQG